MSLIPKSMRLLTGHTYGIAEPHEVMGISRSWTAAPPSAPPSPLPQATGSPPAAPPSPRCGSFTDLLQDAGAHGPRVHTYAPRPSERTGGHPPRRALEFYRQVLAKNASNWMAANSVGLLLRGKEVDAAPLYEVRSLFELFFGRSDGRVEPILNLAQLLGVS